MFQSSAKDEFLQRVAFGKQAEAKKMLDMNSSLMDSSLFLERGKVTNRANRTFASISGLQYAAWAYDTHMLRMILSCVPDDKKADALEQLESLEKNGTEHGTHFDLTRTKMAYQTYIENCEWWSYQKCKDYWCKEVGGAQREWEPHMAEEMCFPGRPFYPMPTFKEVDLPRGAKFDDGSEWFPLKVDSGLGFDFACLRSDLRHGAAQFGSGGERELRGGLTGEVVFAALPQSDLEAMSHLYDVRALELADIIKQLRLEVEKLKPTAAKPPQPSS
jgi:hypothetical protein